MQAAFERALGTMDEFAAGQASVQKAARKIARAPGRSRRSRILTRN